MLPNEDFYNHFFFKLISGDTHFSYKIWQLFPKAPMEKIIFFRKTGSYETKPITVFEDTPFILNSTK